MPPPPFPSPCMIEISPRMPHARGGDGFILRKGGANLPPSSYSFSPSPTRSFFLLEPPNLSRQHGAGLRRQGEEGVGSLGDGGSFAPPISQVILPSPCPTLPVARAAPSRGRGKGRGSVAGRAAATQSPGRAPDECLLLPRFLLRPALRRSPAGHGRWGFALWRPARQPQPAALRRLR